MPVGFDTRRIISFDDMNWLDLLRKIKAYLALSPESIICAADLIFATGAVLDDVEVADDHFLGRRVVFVGRGRQGAEIMLALLNHVFEFQVRTAELYYPFDHLSFAAESGEGVPARKLRIVPPF